MSDTNPPLFKFDDFYLDRKRQCLTFQDQPVSLTPKAFQTLVLLLQNHGDIVEKEYFLDQVWPDTFVEESTLAQNILTLRKTLRRFNQETDFIVTIPRRGYQFVGDVQGIYPEPEIPNVAQNGRRGLTMSAAAYDEHSVEPAEAAVDGRRSRLSWLASPVGRIS